MQNYSPPKLLLDDATKMVDYDTVSLVTLVSFDEEEEEEEEEEECPISPSLSPRGSEVTSSIQ